MTRNSSIRHWTDVLSPDNARYPESKELLSHGSPIGRATGLVRLGVHHCSLPPGRRASWPHAESEEEELVFAIAGTPDVWVDGRLYRLAPGDTVGFPAGTGMAHTLLNDTEEEVRYLVVGESLATNKIHYPLHPDRNASLGHGHWDDAPLRDLGPHDGLPTACRSTLASGIPEARQVPTIDPSSPSTRPPFIVNWTTVIEPDDAHYPGSDELLSIGSPIGRATGLTRIGVHHERLLPGRRTSFPHAEHDEEELVFVLAGTPDVWLDGDLFRLAPGDAVGFPAGTGLAHTFLNDTEEEIRLFVVGERSDPSHKIHYPLHPERNTALGDRHWADAPVTLRRAHGTSLGPHDGMPKAVRERSRVR